MIDAPKETDFIKLSFHSSGNRQKTPNGNTASISGLASFAYDGFNRLATSQTAAETTTYSYNALGQRIGKQNQNGLATSFHYGPNGELLYEQDQAGNSKAYVWLDGRPLARIDNNQQVYYYHVDHLGTPQAMTDASGTVVWKAYYEPFGRATIRVNTVENNLRYKGQYADRETGMHYNYFRDYDPTTGRYPQADPIGLAGGLNLYAYVGGNPVNAIDPLGLFEIYGNWTGSNWSGGKNGPIIPVNPAGPVDAVDACAMQHDYCYATTQASKSQCTANRPHTISDCDAQLARCTLSADPSKLSLWGKVVKPFVSTWAVLHGAAQ